MSGRTYPKPENLSPSRLRDAHTCYRLHHLKWVLGYEPVAVPEPLRFGSLMHRGLNAWWNAMALRRGSEKDQYLLPLSAFAPPPLDAALIAVNDAEPFERAKARALVRGYDEAWSGQKEPVLGVELRYEAPLRRPGGSRASRRWRMTGRMDALVVGADSATYVLEHKTTSEDISDGAPFWDRLMLDTQVSCYVDGAAALGHKVSGVIYDVIRKPALKPLQVNKRRSAEESPDEYEARVLSATADGVHYQRRLITRSEAERAQHARDTWATSLTLAEVTRRAQRDKTLPPPNPTACHKWGRACEYLPVCTGRAQLEDRNLYRLRRSRAEGEAA